MAASEIAAVAKCTYTALCFTGKHGSNEHAVKARSSNCTRALFVDLFVTRYKYRISNWVENVLGCHATKNTVRERFNLLATFNERSNFDSLGCAAVVHGHSAVLCNVDE